ncbi:MAG: beta-galactosidase [Maribacter sp.]
MKTAARTNFFILVFFATSTLFLAAQRSNGHSRIKQELNQDWEFYLEKNQGAQLELHTAKAKWQSVSIPHTLELVPSDVSGLDTTHQPKFHRNVGWYRKKIQIPIESHQRVFLEFEGVHQVTNLWVNGSHVGTHSIGGYTPFHFDITNVIHTDGRPNEILLSADNRLDPAVPPDGNQYDYIKFGGLYRDVYLVTTSDLYVTFPWEARNAGITITTPTVTKRDATIDIKTTVRNEASESRECKLVTRIIDDKGLVVSKMQTIKTIAPKSDHTFSQIDGISENLRLWSIETPYLYRALTTLYIDGAAVDEVENKFGVRKFEFIRDQGFLLNGKPVELIGANRHQAYPFIGDAVPNSLHWKDAWQFKQAGFNVVRLAHYPHDNSFIEACDELGILVYEEPPSWIGIGDEAWFENLEEATRRMIRNHRNHPSILLWGGSLNHRGPVPQLHYACKQEDPTRLTASNGSPWSGPRNSGVTDIYTPMDYQNMELNPEEFVFLCEHGSAADASRNQFEVSKAKASANHIGVAVWTAHDYQAFKPNRGLHPRRIFSMYREPNPVYYWYQSELRNEPMIHIADKRATEDEKILVFSNAEEVELSLNGQVVGRQFPDRNDDRMYIDHPSFTFDYPWIEGTLVAKGISNGRIVASHSLEKPTAPYRLKVVIEEDNRPFYANGSDMKVVKAYILDKKGNHITTDTTAVSFSIRGKGDLIGDATIGANPFKAYYGVATALIRSKSEPGKITVAASADGLLAAKAAINTVEHEKSEKPMYYELKQAKIDFGGNEERLVQFGWNEWNPTFKSAPSAFPELNLAITTDTELEWQNGWGLSANLAYVGADAVSAEKNMTLVCNGLPEGAYTLTTYHHSMEEYQKSPTYTFQVDDASGTSKYTIRPSMGNRLGNAEPKSKSIEIEVKNNTPITIRLSVNVDAIPVLLNGLKITEIKKEVSK